LLTEEQLGALARSLICSDAPRQPSAEQEQALLACQARLPAPVAARAEGGDEAAASADAVDKMLSQSREAWRNIQAAPSFVDGIEMNLLLSPLDLWCALAPVAAWAEANEPADHRGIVGVAGPPGVGKSAYAVLLKLTMESFGCGPVVYLPMDGYHFENSLLDIHFAPGPAGTPLPLREFKGIPETFDAVTLLEDLTRARERGAELHLPAYNRVSHDPVPGAIPVSSQARWIILEGNFLLLDEEKWRRVGDLLDLSVGIDASDALLRLRLEERFRRGGRDPVWVHRHWQRVDGPNAERVRASTERAQVRLRSGLNWALRPDAAPAA